MKLPPNVGVGVIILKDGRVLMGRRLSNHQPGTWCPPGGKLDWGESFIACARRETKEEAGISIKNCQVVATLNNIFDNGLHGVTIIVQADWQAGKPKIMEPDKIADWDWYEWDKLPRPLFPTITGLIKTGYKPA